MNRGGEEGRREGEGGENDVGLYVYVIVNCMLEETNLYVQTPPAPCSSLIPSNPFPSLPIPPRPFPRHPANTLFNPFVKPIGPIRDGGGLRHNRISGVS